MLQCGAFPGKSIATDRDNDKRRCGRKVLYLTYFSCGVHLCNMSHIFLAAPT